MRKTGADSVWIWLLSAVAFFALVILYFLGPRVIDAFRAPSSPTPYVYQPDPAPEPAASPLPTAAVRMKIKRIEPRKYRREGELPPPPSVR